MPVQRAHPHVWFFLILPFSSLCIGTNTSQSIDSNTGGRSGSKTGHVKDRIRFSCVQAPAKMAGYNEGIRHRKNSKHHRQ